MKFHQRLSLAAAVFLLLWCGINLPVAQAEKIPETEPITEEEELQHLLLFFEEEALVKVATLHPKKSKYAPAIITVITEEQIKNMGARNLAEALITVPGFGLQTSQGWSRFEFEVRGIGGVRNSEKVLLLVDGHKFNDPFFGGATTVTDDFPLDNVKQIEIIRGPGSALYGDNAFMAVINIVTKKSADIDGLKLTAGGGSFDTTRYNILFGKEVSGVKFSVNLNYFNTDSDERFIPEDELTGGPTGASEAPGFTNRHRERYDAQLNLDYGELGFMGRFISKEQGALIGARDHLGDDSLYKFDAFYSELHHKHNFTPSLSVFNKLYFDQFDIDFLFELFPEGTDFGAGEFTNGVLFQGKATERTYGYNLRVDYELFEGNLVTMGFVYEYTTQSDVTSEANFDPLSATPQPTEFQSVAEFTKEKRRSLWAFYVQDDWAITDWLSLIAGMRHDYYNDVGKSINPRIGLVLTPATDFHLKLLYNQAFRAPSFEELYNQNNRGVIGNSDLHPEELETWEIGLDYQLWTNYHIAVNYFHTDIEDLIFLDRSFPRQFKNMGKAETQGVEAEFKAMFTNGNYGYINYTFQRAIDRAMDGWLPDVPKQRGNIGVNWALGKYINLQPHIFWSDKRLRAKGDERGNLPSYAVADLSLIAKNFYNTLEIRASVHNLFDKEYVHPAQPSLPNDYPQPGRDFFVEASYFF